MKNVQEIKTVESADEFFRMLQQWHARKVATLEHLLTIPEGSEVQLNDDTTIVLEGENHAAFTVGITTALMEMGTLPFAVINGDEEELPKATVQSNATVSH